MWDFPLVTPDPTNERGVINQLPAQGMDPRVITPILRPLRSAFGSFATFHHLLGAIYDGHQIQKDIGIRVPVNQTSVSAAFADNRLQDLLDSGATGETVATAIRENCYANRQRQKEVENMLVLDDLAAANAPNLIRKLVMRWHAIHFTALAEAQTNWLRRHYVGKALSNSVQGKITTIALRG